MGTTTLTRTLHLESTFDTVELIKASPLNAEARPEALTEALTPADAFFIRTNFDIPAIDPARFGLEVSGLVARPGRWALARLSALGTAREVVTVECAGNGRVTMAPLAPGELWSGGAVSTASRGGIPLSALLAEVAPATGATHVHFEGADLGVVRDRGGDPIHFVRSLSLADAMRAEVMLATEMNDEPLAREHGAPLRLIVPGWYGMASVKWLQRIVLTNGPTDGWFQRDRYVYQAAAGGEAIPVTRMKVKSRIVAPATGALLPRGTVRVQGWAWSGEAPIAGVEVAIGGGDWWHEAELGPDLGPYAWRAFSYTFQAREIGRQVLRARARDRRGNIQPAEAPSNRLGYGNNAIEPVILTIG